MTRFRHTRSFRVDALVAILAVTLFAAAPLLLENHHHSELSPSAHCAVCAFASAHIVPAGASAGVTLDLASSPQPFAQDETLASAPATYTRNERAPPTV